MKDDPRVYQAYADYLVKFVQAYEAEGVPVYGLTIQNEPQNRHPSGYPGTDLPVRQAVQVIDRLGPALKAAGLDDEDLRLRPQLVAAPRRREGDPARRGPGARVPRRPARVERRPLARRHGVPLLRRRPEADDRAAPAVPGQGHLVHRVLRLARPHRPAGPGLLRHPQVAHPQPHARRHPQLGEVDGHLEPRAASRRRPAQRRLRHLHRRGHRPGRRHRHPQRGVLHARPPLPLRAAGRPAGGQHVVRHHRLERHADELGVREPRRLHRPAGAQRARRPADDRGRGRRAVVRLHAARRRAGHLHLAGLEGTVRWRRPGRPVDHHGDREHR